MNSFIILQNQVVMYQKYFGRNSQTKFDFGQNGFGVSKNSDV